MAMDEEREDVRKMALKFMVSLSKAKVWKVNGWTAVIIRGCLEGMGEGTNDNLNVWLEADICCTFSDILQRAVLSYR